MPASAAVAVSRPPRWSVTGVLLLGRVRLAGFGFERPERMEPAPVWRLRDSFSPWTRALGRRVPMRRCLLGTCRFFPGGGLPDWGRFRPTGSLRLVLGRRVAAGDQDVARRFSAFAVRAAVTGLDTDGADVDALVAAVTVVRVAPLFVQRDVQGDF